MSSVNRKPLTSGLGLDDMSLAWPAVVQLLVFIYCCCFVVHSTRRFLLSLALCYLVFFSLFSIAITSLGEEKANLSVFPTFVRFALV